MKVRVRFAPSPTGFLHIGGARTALFNFLFAKANGGQFLLRIEDTDPQRSEAKYTTDIMESLKWLGLNWDEPPVFQSKRFEIYRELAEKLIQEKKAYRCDCSEETLNAVRAKCEKEKRAFRYPGTCRNKTSVEGPSVIRMAIPKTGETTLNDLIRGPITVQHRDIDDWVLQRADGSPTYNFCVVIDDHAQECSHILRGDDHINNTPKQILLYQALGYQVPQFAHLPMILGPDRAKLSKRHGAASTLEYRKMGYLPEVLINFLVRLGWSHGDQEFFTQEELEKYFSLKNIGKANAVFNVEKLNWISGQMLQKKSTPELAAYLKEYFKEDVPYLMTVDEKRLELGIQIIQGKVKTLVELIEQLDCLFGADPTYDLSKMNKEDQSKIRGYLQACLGSLKDSSFSHDDLGAKVKVEAEKLGLKVAPVAQALRWAVTGGKVSPGLFEMLEVQGKEVVLRRMESAVKALSPT